MTRSITDDSVSFVMVGDQKIRVMHRNPGVEHPLLLINGVGAPLEMWHPFIAELADRQVICLDLPGCGLSPVPRIPLRMRGIADTVVRVLDVLGLARVDVLGYSFGGIVSMELAHRYPDRVRRLVLASTMPGTPSMMPHPIVFGLMLNPLRYYNRRAAQVMVPLIAGGRTARDAKKMKSDLTLRQSHPPSWRGYTYQLFAVSTFSSWPWLHSVLHPTLVVHGRADPLSPVFNAELMSATLPNAQLHIVPDGGHLLLLDDPTTVVPRILAFLEATKA
ncbi:UNVERIFIED_CONTAM: pimeloyl-ACP methyl ester carboxylesterase [Williamsia faeni]